MKRILALAVACTLCAGAYADIGHYLDACYQPEVEPGSDSLHTDFNDGTYWTCDLWATVSNGDDWTSSSAMATIDSGVFFDHTFGDNTPPLAGLVGSFPALEYDSFYLSTLADPLNQPPFADPSFAGDVVNDPQLKVVEAWFTTPDNGGVGDFLIARYTIHAPDFNPDDPSTFVTFNVVGASTTMDGGGTLYPFNPDDPDLGLSCVIPEPASLALLGLGLALIRRR